MIYSVWRPDRQHYEYYQDTKGVSDDGPRPTPRKHSKLGNAPGEISWKLPSGAEYSGNGHAAKGVVVHPDTLGDFDLGSASVIGIAAIALGLYMLVR